MSICSSVSSKDNADPMQSQISKGSWVAFGMRSIFTLTGAALGAVAGGYATRSLAGVVFGGGSFMGAEIDTVLLLVMPMTQAQGAIEGGIAGAFVGYSFANRILKMGASDPQHSTLSRVKIM